MVTRLQVTYRSPEVDDELDKKILQFFNTLDFICINRNYHSIIFRRDIFFEKRDVITEGLRYKGTKEGEYGSKRNQKVELKA